MDASIDRRTDWGSKEGRLDEVIGKTTVGFRERCVVVLLLLRYPRSLLAHIHIRASSSTSYTVYVSPHTEAASADRSGRAICNLHVRTPHVVFARQHQHGVRTAHSAGQCLSQTQSCVNPRPSSSRGQLSFQSSAPCLTSHLLRSCCASSEPEHGKLVARSSIAILS